MLGLRLALEVRIQYLYTWDNTYSVSAVEERHIETLIHNTLRNIILVRSIPRTKVEITLQLKSLPEEHAVCCVYRTLTILPHLLHTALLALLSSSIPLRTTITSALVVIPAASSASPLVIPSAKDIFRAKPIKSTHVFAFSGDRQLLLNESEGEFSYEEWDDACEQAEEVCCKEGGVGLADAMQVDEPSENLEAWLREVVKQKVDEEQRWKVTT
jgi:exosome complex component RRP46